jgi:hypothetical protein
MEHPPLEVSDDELLLDVEKVSQMSAYKICSDYISSLDGVIPESEILSYNDVFGYIFRYEVSHLVEDDGLFHPEDLNLDRNSSFVRWKIVAHSIDGKQIKVVSIPLFEL